MASWEGSIGRLSVCLRSSSPTSHCCFPSGVVTPGCLHALQVHEEPFPAFVWICFNEDYKKEG